jgi:hypothetical protein
MIRWIADWVRLGRWTTGCGVGGVKPVAGACCTGGGGAAGVSRSVGGVGWTGAAGC